MLIISLPNVYIFSKMAIFIFSVILAAISVTIAAVKVESIPGSDVVLDCLDL